jgi:zinc protease
VWRKWIIGPAVVLAAGMAGRGIASGQQPPAPLTAPRPPAVAGALAFEKITLPNGLVVILNEDHRVPLVGYGIHFLGGTWLDPPGRRGMTWLLREILSHPTTRHLDEKTRGAVLRTLDAPAWTPEVGNSMDETWIRGRVPSGALELALWVESDRMGFLADGVDVESVRKAVEEIGRTYARNTDGAEARLRAEVARAVWGEGHPYGGISWGPPELDGIAPAEVRARLRSWYGPASAVLALSGDITPAAAKALCQRYFGGIVGGPRPPAATRGQAFPPPALQGEQRIRIEADVEEAAVTFGWPTPAFYQEDDFLLDGLARVLGARLQKRLAEGGPVKEVAVRQASSNGGSLFSVRITLRPGKAPADAIAAVEQEIAQLRGAGPNEDEVRAARLHWLFASAQDEDDVQHRAYDLARSEGVTGDPARLALRPAAYAGITAAGLRKVAVAHLTDRRVVGQIVPTPGAPKAGRVVPAQPVRTETPVASREPPKTPVEDGGETPDETFRYRPPLVDVPQGWPPPPIVEVRVGGARALLVERHDLPLATARVSVRIEDREPRPGLDEMALVLTIEGATAGGGPSLRAALAGLGAQLRSFNAWDEGGVEITASAPVLGEALAATLRSFAGVDPGQEGYDALRARVVEQRKQAPAHTEMPRERLFRAISDLLPAGHRYREPAATTADVETIKLPEAARRRASLMTPAEARISVVGDITPAALRAALEPAMAAWKRGATRTTAKPPPISRGALLIEDEGAKRVELAVVLPAPAPGDEENAVSPFVEWALNKVVFDWMKKEITTPWNNGRVERIERRDLGLMYVSVSVEPGDMVRAARGILDALDRVAHGEGVDDVLATTRRAGQRFFDGRYTTQVDAARWLGWSNVMDLPVDRSARIYAAFLRAGRAEVVAAAAARLRRERARVVAVGPVAAAEAEIKQLGLGQVMLVRPDKDAAKGAKKK